ncbi:hypothetical protein cyc_06550 [Cyclospora cayetanensis]|uniref:Uncharacterized protein n=1 Tax=Cyclospora cayetanensis TaxID=88456 RepID=A0A1D3D9E8_9EIME|nr:hypothetical protein cyc_06550 [Cyclospora cayetanensis]
MSIAAIKCFMLVNIWTLHDSGNARYLRAQVWGVEYALSCRRSCVLESLAGRWLVNIWMLHDSVSALFAFKGVRALRRLWQDDAELAGGVEASGSRAPMVESALVSSCAIACIQGNNVNSNNRMVYEVRSLHAHVWGVECGFTCSLCADGAHMLMPVYVGDLQEVGCASRVGFGCGGEYAANVSSNINSSNRMAYVKARIGGPSGLLVQERDDVELAGGVGGSGSRAPVLKSALVSSYPIACAQSNNINSSNRTAYWPKVKARIGGPSGLLVGEQLSTFE